MPDEFPQGAGVILDPFFPWIELPDEQDPAADLVEPFEAVHEVAGAGAGVVKTLPPRGRHTLGAGAVWELVAKLDAVALMFEVDEMVAVVPLVQDVGIIECVYVPILEEGGGALQRRHPPVEGKGPIEAEMLFEPVRGAATVP